MTKIVLEVLSNGKIKPPDFCPYKTVYNRVLISGRIVSEDTMVDPHLCVLCRLCTFVPKTAIVDTGITREEQEALARFLTATCKETSSSLSGQNQYLAKEGRVPLAVLMSYSLFEDALHAISTSEEHYKALHSHFSIVEEPLCYVMGCPVYLSRKLTKSRVQVVGEITWK